MLALATPTTFKESRCADCKQPVEEFPKFGRGRSRYCADCLAQRLSKRQWPRRLRPSTQSTQSAARPASADTPAEATEPAIKEPMNVVVIARYGAPVRDGAEPEPIIDAEIAARIQAKVREVASEAAREVAESVVHDLAPTITREIVVELAPSIARAAIRELLLQVVAAGVS